MSNQSGQVVSGSQINVGANPTSELTLNQYQARAAHTALYPVIGGHALVYPTLGLADEAGEVSGCLKKMFRDDDGQLTDERRQKMIKELGDVLWYIAAVARELDVSLGHVAFLNLHKLKDRQERGVIGGDGDDR